MFDGKAGCRDNKARAGVLEPLRHSSTVSRDEKSGVPWSKADAVRNEERERPRCLVVAENSAAPKTATVSASLLYSVPIE